MLRLLRVFIRRWAWIIAFLALGGAIAYGVMTLWPPVYLATATFTLNLQRAAGGRPAAVMENGYASLINTGYSAWHSDAVLLDVLKRYRARHVASKEPDDEIVQLAARADFELLPRSRVIQISVFADSPELASEVASCYVEAIAEYYEAENRRRCNEGVASIRQQAEDQRLLVKQLSERLVRLRTASKLDGTQIDLKIADSEYQQVAEEVTELEAEESRLVELEMLLATLKDNPRTDVGIPPGATMASEVYKELRACQEAEDACRAMLGTYTRRHPQVRLAGMEVLAARKRLKESAGRAYETCKSTLDEVRSRLQLRRERKTEIETERSGLVSGRAYAEASLQRCTDELKIAQQVLQELLIRENTAFMQVERGCGTVQLGQPSAVPESPYFPNPLWVYGGAGGVFLALGLAFAWFLDSREDLLFDLEDLVARLPVRVLTVLPHVYHRQRANVARSLEFDPHTEFAEGIETLRQNLDLVRAENRAAQLLVVSTQPGEGKTITSTSIAISLAQAGFRTLLADFDLRRPQQATIWNLALSRERSFSHVLETALDTTPDFSRLVNAVPVKNLQVIASLPPDDVHPASIFGRAAVKAFFSWAQVAYDYVVVDAPPFGLVGDVVSLATLVDTVLVMCRPDRSSVNYISACVNYLTEAGANIGGIVVNDANSSVSLPTGGQRLRNCQPDTELSAADLDEFDRTRQFTDDE